MNVEHRQIASMGTRLDLVLAGVDSQQAAKLAGEVRGELMRIEQKLSAYRDDSEISLLNRTAHAGPVEVDGELWSILVEGKELHRETGGYFDITMGPVAGHYRNGGDPAEPLPQGIAEIVGMEHLLLHQGTVRFARKGMFLDLGGYGKGYALKRIMPLLRTSGLKHALLSFGESLVLGWGTHPYGSSWMVEIPSEGEAVRFHLVDQTLSTSGNSLNNQKKFRNSGHVVNPVTRQMVRGLGQVSVKSDDPVQAEVFSTALFSAGPEASEAIAQGLPGMEYHWELPSES